MTAILHRIPWSLVVAALSLYGWHRLWEWWAARPRKVFPERTIHRP
jgi:hypothetical protein